MKVLFINPATKKDRRPLNGKIKGSDIFRYPKLGILSVAALTPKEFRVEFVDEIIENINFKTDADIIAISAVTALAPRSFEIAEEFKKRDKTIIMGGMHATFLPDECLKHVDSVVIGPAEGAWDSLLDDYSKGRLKRKYVGSLANPMSLPPACRIPEGRKGYAQGHVFGITRGCVHRCEFCSVRSFYNGSYHKRPISEVIREMKALPWKIINIVDDNIFCDPGYAKELFRALIPLKKHLLFQASVDIADDPELMALIRDAGGKGVFIGIETLDQANLRHMKKDQNIIRKYKRVIKIFHKHGIVVEAGMMFGFDCDNKGVFKDARDFGFETNLDLMQIAIVTPMPGTAFYDKLNSEKRICDHDWAHYDCKHAVFTPKNMTKEELLDGADWLRKQFYSYPSILRRGTNNLFSLGLIGTFGYFLRGNLGFRKNYKEFLDYPP